jgi:imidazolonepropionase
MILHWGYTVMLMQGIQQLLQTRKNSILNFKIMKLIGPFKQLLTMDRLPDRGPLSDDQLQIITDGGIIVSEGKIKIIGDFLELKNQSNPSSIEYLEGDYVALPGMIDAHTHICWAGSRANDYALRLSGKSYLEIAAMGGGIWDTVIKTRNTSIQELAEKTMLRANKLLKNGITTIEVKSGYGLSVSEELKLLESIDAANQKTAADLIATCLAAHMVPKDFEGNESEYLELIIRELLPVVFQNKLAKRIDIYVEQSAFSIHAAKAYLLKAKEMGFDLVIHGDQFASGVAALANEVGALSMDHLEAADEKEIEIFARGNVMPIVLPGASLGLGDPFAPARKLLDAGTSLVIASDWNPGSAPMGNLLAQAAIMGAVQKLTMTETWAAMTCRAAKALNKTDRGILKNGNLADIIAFKTDDYRDVLYCQGQLKPAKVWKKGVIV